jgi:integrase
MRPLSGADAFLEAARESSDRFEALYVLAIATGLRRGQLLGLRWDDVDLERGTLQVGQGTGGTGARARLYPECP